MPNTIMIQNYTTDINSLLKIVCGFHFVEGVYLYGSRARANYQASSDIDLAIFCPNATDNDWANVMEAIEDAPFLKKIDVVRLDNLKTDQSLYKAIMRDKILLYKKGQNIIDPYFMDAFYKVQKAFSALKNIAHKPMQEDRSNIDATIQRFEFTIELF